MTENCSAKEQKVFKQDNKEGMANAWVEGGNKDGTDGMVHICLHRLKQL